MHTASEGKIEVGTANQHRLTQIIQASHKKFIDLNTVLPWEDPINKSLLPKSRESLWLNGTEYLQTLSAEQQRELAWQEIARDVSTFIYLEETLPPLYVGYINRYGDELDKHIREYLMIFSKEEIIHTLMFRRYMAKANLSLWQPPKEFVHLLTVILPNETPAAGIFFTFAIEWLAEICAMFRTQHTEVEPLTRQLFHAHHMEESRHIAFGRWVSEWLFDHAPEAEIAKIKAMAQQLVPMLVDKYLYDPAIRDYLSFDFPAPDYDNTTQQIRHSDSNQKIRQHVLKEYYGWFNKIGISLP